MTLIAGEGGGTVEAVPEVIAGRTAHGRFLFVASVELFEDYGFTRQSYRWCCRRSAP
ncbi:hypothetical protein [Flindersiella endophytica]